MIYLLILVGIVALSVYQTEVEFRKAQSDEKFIDKLVHSTQVKAPKRAKRTRRGVKNV